MFLGRTSIDAGLADPHTNFYLVAGLLIAWLGRNSQQIFTGLGERLLAARPLALRPFVQGAEVGAILFFVVAVTLISLSWGTNEFIYFNF
jgi:hypothetical protein